MRTIIVLLLIASPCTAIAGGFGNIFAGFANGVNQTQQQNYNSQQDSVGSSHYLTQDMVGALMAQYKTCVDANINPILERQTAFDAVVAQHNVNKILNYSGTKDGYITKVIRNFKKTQDALNNQNDKYIKGEITHTELSRNQSSIKSAFQSNLNKIIDDDDKALDVHLKEQESFCGARLEAQEQGIYDDETEQTIARQHQRIEELDEQNQAAKQALIANYRKLQQAKEEAAEAERKEQEAEGEAEQESQRAQQAGYR